MNLITFTLLVSMVIANELARLGKLYIYKIDGVPVVKNLLIAFDEVFVLNDRASIFGFEQRGTLQLFSSGQYLNIVMGRLVLSGMPQCGFGVSEIGGSDGKRKLSFNGKKSFQLCDDHLVGFRSNCVGARKVLIGFEELA